MKKSLFLVITICSIIVICGVVVLSRFVGTRSFNTMMDGGMANQQQMKDTTRGMQPSGVRPDNVSERDAQGAELLGRYCTQCHELPNPRMHSAEEWPSVVENMQDIMRTRGKSEIADNEKKAITKYLIQHSH